jgi:hypothetical protein
VSIVCFIVHKNKASKADTGGEDHHGGKV